MIARFDEVAVEPHHVGDREDHHRRDGKADHLHRKEVLAVPVPPAEGDAYFHQKQRDNETAKRENETKFHFLVAVRWFLRDFANFDLPVPNADPGDPTNPKGRPGLFLLDNYFSNKRKAFRKEA